ncbi:MAG: Ca-activated chloride channel [Sphingomonadales bacterium]|nr:Ca-activated chloride channel [Sphingomonadales bacterium]
MPNPNVALILDCSDSMKWSNYFVGAQTAQATFVNVMRTNDNVGLVGFSDTAWIFFPADGTSQLVPITGVSVQNQAVQAIQNQTTHMLTNMTAAIATARGMLTSAAAPRAIVLLSDGYYTGVDPLINLPTDIPIHTVALGPASDVGTLQQIAYLTCGQGLGYHYADNPFVMMKVYNMIVQSANVAQNVVNNSATVANFQVLSVPMQIEPGQSEARAAVTWTDPNTAYAPGPPVGAQVNVGLQDPNGATATPTTVTSGRGFVVMTVANPIAGAWQIGLWTAQAGAAAGLQTVQGGFQPGGTANLTLAFEGGGKVGSPAPFRAQVTHDGAPIDNVRLMAVAEAPLVSVAQALKRHSRALAKMAVPSDGGAGAASARLANLAKLHAQQPGGIMPRENYPVLLAPDGSGGHCGHLSRTDVPGPHSVHVVATGRSPVDGSPFRREALLSVNIA